MNEPMIQHPILGDLVYEEVLQGYVGSIELSDMPLKINLVTNSGNVDVLAQQLITFLESDEFEHAFIAGLERLLVIKNNDWLNDGEAEYTLEELCDFVSLDAIVMFKDKIELYTDDLELLWRNRAIFKYNHQYQLINVAIDLNAE